MPEVVESQSVDANCDAGCPPLDRPVRSAQRRALRAGEHQRVVPGRDVGREVSLELGNERRRDRDGAAAGIGLRRTKEQRAGHLYERFGDDLDDDTVTIPLSLARRELGELVSTTFETVIRIMSRWAREGVLETTPSGFVIHRLDIIRSIGDGESTEPVQKETGTSI